MPAPGVAQLLRSDEPRGAAGTPAAAGAALDSLGSSLLRQLPVGDNAVLSPYSIYTVLAMARAGANRETAAQLDVVLGGDAAVQAGTVTAVDKAVQDGLAAGKPPEGGDPKYTDARPETVEVANSVWLSPLLPVRPSYLEALATGFGVGLYKVDYQADPEAARAAVNNWVEQHTGKLIPELIDKGVITSRTVVTLVNALHVSAPWAKEFDKTTTPIPFTNAAGKISVPGMSVVGALDTAAGRGWTSVTVPYRGAGLAMTVVLPDAGSFAAVRAQLSTVLQAATTSKQPAPVNLTMPSFGSQTHLSLKKAMQALGVTDIFDSSRADLSGIAGNPGDIYATDLIHQSVITVDEKGTEAAAATAMMMEPASGFAAINNVTVDRPFFYAIRDTVTGAPLFLGQVTDPTA